MKSLYIALQRMRSVSRAGCVELYSDLQRAPERSTSLSSWLSALHSTPSLSVWANTRSSVDRVLNANLSVPVVCAHGRNRHAMALSHTQDFLALSLAKYTTAGASPTPRRSGATHPLIRIVH